jgi:hypothetical protein
MKTLRILGYVVFGALIAILIGSGLFLVWSDATMKSSAVEVTIYSDSYNADKLLLQVERDDYDNILDLTELYRWSTSSRTLYLERNTTYLIVGYTTIIPGDPIPFTEILNGNGVILGALREFEVREDTDSLIIHLR